MSLHDIAKADIERITSDPTEWGKTIVFVAPTAETCTIVGLHKKHRMMVGTDGAPVNGKNATISVSEKFLTDAAYPVRGADGEVDLKDHIVTVADSTGEDKEYVIREWYPDETVGLIVCILGDYEE